MRRIIKSTDHGIVLVTLVVLVIAALYFGARNRADTEEATMLEPTSEPGVSLPSALSDSAMMNATWTISGEPLRLRDGMVEVAAAPGSAAREVTRYQGIHAITDLNQDGKPDIVVVLVQESAGTGIFYLLTGKVSLGDEYRQLTPLLIGDRIRILSLAVDAERDDRVVLDYLDRRPEQPMADEPLVSHRRWYLVRGEQTLVESSN